MTRIIFIPFKSEINVLVCRTRTMKCTETQSSASVCDRAHCLKIECAGGQKKWNELTAYAPNA